MAASPTMNVELSINDAALQEILTAINGTKQNQLYLFEMLMNTTIAITRLVSVLHSSDLSYSTPVRECLDSIDLDVLNQQIAACNEALQAWDSLNNVEVLDGEI